MPRAISFPTIEAQPAGVLQNLFRLGSGEMVARLANIAIVVWLGHRYGVVILGIYALAQSVTQYLQPVIDFGLRHVGARLLAMYPQAAREIVRRVQRRRARMAAAAVPLILVYSASAKLPLEMRIFLFVFSLAGALYAVSLDWAAWGRGRLHLVGLAKSVVPVSILGFLLIGRPSTKQVLWCAAAGNGFGFALQGGFFHCWWKNERRHLTDQWEAPGIVCASLAWRRTSVMGLAWFCYLAFNSIDVMMLGLMSNPEQVGLYSAAYRVLNQVLATYYVLTQVLYPRFARYPAAERPRMLKARILAPLVAFGILIAAGICWARRGVLSVVFGHPFLAAAPLLLLLAWSVPLDFATSYLSNAFLAWGLERKVRACTAIAALTDVLLNLAFIPSLGARAAAVNTLISYAVLLAGLGLTGRTIKDIGATARHKPAVAAQAGGITLCSRDAAQP
jgi:O-antigen/teichoic acid export membrane protein